jgi:putative selenate reductase FAD-binding subunit
MIKTFYKPECVAEALELKARFGAKACWFGGGTSINNALFGSPCEKVIGLEKLDLRRIEKRDGWLEIGAGVTLQELIDAPQVPPALRQAAGHLWSRNVRNLATIGGNIGARRSDSCLLPCLMALEAQLELAPEGCLSIEEYLRVRSNDLILKVLIPAVQGACRVQRIARQAKGPTIVTAAVRIVSAAGRRQKAVIALGGVAKEVIRLAGVEQGLVNGTISDKPAIERAVAQAIAAGSFAAAATDYLTYISGVTIADLVEACRAEKESA